MASFSTQRGFTLVELIMVIVIMGVIGGIVSVFMKAPIDAYFDSVRRAALTDVADTTVRRMARDLRKALPNSVRTPNDQCVEFIPTKTGGRYRAQDSVLGDGTSLDFEVADTTFNMIGRNSDLPLVQRIVQDDVVAIYNLGIDGAQAYQQDNTSRVAQTPVEGAETQITIDSKQFPLASGSQRFHVIPKDEKVVAYVCQGGNLYRTASSTFSSACPTTGALLARQVVACNFAYTGADALRNALVQLNITLTDQGESVSLYQEVHVSNTP